MRSNLYRFDVGWVICARSAKITSNLALPTIASSIRAPKKTNSLVWFSKISWCDVLHWFSFDEMMTCEFSFRCLFKSSNKLFMSWTPSSTSFCTELHVFKRLKAYRWKWSTDTMKILHFKNFSFGWKLNRKQHLINLTPNCAPTNCTYHIPIASSARVNRLVCHVIARQKVKTPFGDFVAFCLAYAHDNHERSTSVILIFHFLNMGIRLYQNECRIWMVHSELPGHGCKWRAEQPNRSNGHSHRR